MEDRQKRKIAEFVRDTTNLITEWGFDANCMQRELLQLHKIIGQLIQERFRTKDPIVKDELADLENQARNCRQLIAKRTLMSKDT